MIVGNLGEKFLKRKEKKRKEKERKAKGLGAWWYVSGKKWFETHYKNGKKEGAR